MAISVQDLFLSCYSTIKDFTNVKTYDAQTPLPQPCPYLKCECQFFVGPDGQRWPVYVQKIVQPTLETLFSQLSLEDKEPKTDYFLEKKYYGRWGVVEEKRGGYYCQKILASYKLDAMVLMACNDEAAIALRISVDHTMDNFFTALAAYHGKPTNEPALILPLIDDK